MTQEQKDMLLKDICARLPYGVKGIDREEKITICAYIQNRIIDDVGISHSIENVKPYLFPFSSMSEEQSLELEIITGDSMGFDAYALHDFTGYGEISLSRTMEIIRWCYKNYIDINGLIPMDLAIDATGLNIY